MLRDLIKASQAVAETQVLSPGVSVLANEVAQMPEAASSLGNTGGGGMSSEDMAELLHARRATKKTQAVFSDLKGMSSVVDIADTIEVSNA